MGEQVVAPQAELGRQGLQRDVDRVAEVLDPAVVARPIVRVVAQKAAGGQTPQRRPLLGGRIRAVVPADGDEWAEF